MPLSSDISTLDLKEITHWYKPLMGGNVDDFYCDIYPQSHHLALVQVSRRLRPDTCGHTRTLSLFEVVAENCTGFQVGNLVLVKNFRKEQSYCQVSHVPILKNNEIKITNMYVLHESEVAATVQEQLFIREPESPETPEKPSPEPF